MAYFYNSNYPENYDNYQNYQYNYNHEPRYVQSYDTEFYGNAYQYAQTPSLVGYYYSSYNQSEPLTSKNANFIENGDYYDPLSTQYVISYNSNTAEEANDVVFEEYNPKPFQGGYDIHEKYGKPLPPSEEICYPPSKIDSNLPSLVPNFSSAPPPYLKEDKKDVVSEPVPKEKPPTLVIPVENPPDLEEDEDEDEDEYDEDEDEYDEDEDDLGDEVKNEEDIGKETSKNDPIVLMDGGAHAKEDQHLDMEAKPKNGNVVNEMIQEEKVSDFEDEDEDEDEEEKEVEGEMVDVGKKVEDDGNQIRRQIPPGYGLEAIDLCDGVLGGYFPCLWKRNQRVYNHQRDSNDNMNDYDYCWKESADYLFGNPNPYGGSMPEKGSYGDPVYNYQRYYPQQPITEQVEYYGENSSMLQSSRYYYGDNGEYR